MDLAGRGMAPDWNWNKPRAHTTSSYYRQLVPSALTDLSAIALHSPCNTADATPNLTNPALAPC